MNRLLQAIRDQQEALYALSDDQLVTLVLQLENQPWGNWQDTVFYHAAPRLAAKLKSLGWGEEEGDFMRHMRGDNRTEEQ